MTRTDGPRVARFFRTFLTLNGSFAGRPFEPLPWVEEILGEIYELDENGRRRVRTYLLGVPRKSAKSTIAAGIGVYQLIADQTDQAPQIVGAAGDRAQARLVFDMAAGMIQASPDLSEVCTVQRNVIRNNETGGTYRVVSADAGLAHGLNPSTTIVDEYHVHRTADLFVALTSGSAMRDQPLTLVISTAGHDLESPLGLMYRYGRQVEAGEIDDPSFGFRWYGPPEGADIDPDDEALWAEYNPSFALMNLAEFRSARLHMPESEFVRYRLNGWTASADAWFPAGVWDRLTDGDKGLEAGDRVVVGFDGSFGGDATALVAVRIADLHVERVGLWERPDGDRGKGWRVPVAEVEERIREICSWLTVQEVVADPYFFQVSLQKLEEEGFPIVEFPTNGIRMAGPTKTFFDAVMDGELTHNGDPAMARHVANTQLKQDARGSRIGKEHKSSTRHIDLTVAAVIAVARARAWREQEPEREPTIMVLR